MSNLPYGDWQKILLAILAAPQEIASCTLMIQADVYDRLRAAPRTREYGPMPVLVQATSTLRKLRRAGKELFLPPPRVESTVFRLERPSPVPDAAQVEARLRELFAQRRKKSAAAGGRRVEELLRRPARPRPKVKCRKGPRGPGIPSGQHLNSRPLRHIVHSDETTRRVHAGPAAGFAGSRRWFMPDQEYGGPGGNTYAT